MREFQGNIFTLKTKYSGPTGTPAKGNIFTMKHKTVQWSSLKHCEKVL